MKTHVGTQLSSGTLALHTHEHSVKVSCYSHHRRRSSREQWKCETWNSVEQLKLGESRSVPVH